MIGSLSETIVRQILSVNQISPDQVKFINLGQNSLTYVALKTGLIDAKTLQVPQTFFAQDEGFRKLAATADFYRVVQGGLTTTKPTLTERPKLTAKVVRATLRAVRLIVNDKKYALEVMKGPHLELGNDRDRFVERTYDAALQAYLTSGVVDERLQREMIAVAAQRVKPQQPIAPERVFDFSFARKGRLPTNRLVSKIACVLGGVIPISNAVPLLFKPEYCGRSFNARLTRGSGVLELFRSTHVVMTWSPSFT